MPDGPLTNSGYLIEEPRARRAHETGLRAALNGDFVAAHDFLDEAPLSLPLPSEEGTSIDSLVQRARIQRDSGFTCARQAIAEDRPTLLDAAAVNLRHSAEDTGALISSQSPVQFKDYQSRQATLKQARREVFAEHGATLGLLGRLATVREVFCDVDTRGDDPASVQTRLVGQRFYGLAHDILRVGNNGYYRVNNAMAGARQERLNGQPKRMLPWLGRAAYGLAWTALHDRRNLKAAARTAAGRLPHLRSYEAARESVLAKP